MWTRRSWALSMKVRLRGTKRVRVGGSVALHVLYQWMLSLEGLVCLLGGHFRHKAQMALNAAQGLMLLLMQSEPQNFVHVEIQDDEQDVFVDVKTKGRKGRRSA